MNFKIDNGIDSFSLKEAKKKIYKIPNFTMNENMKMFYTTGLPPKRRINTGNSAWIRWIYKLYSDNSQFKDNFSFVKKLSDKMFFEQRDEEYWHYSKYIQFQLKIIKPGLIISFINFKIDKEYLLLETEDERTLEEINNIKGYKVFSME